MYMVPHGSNFVTPWDTGSFPGTPISWQHAGIKDCDPQISKELGDSFCRSGKVVVTVGGRPTHSILEKVVEPGIWNITLAGGHAGISYVVIDSYVNSQELTSELLQRAAKTVGSALRVGHAQLCGSLSDGSEHFSVAASGKDTGLAREWWTCGSGGCHLQITFVPQKEYAGDLLNCNR